MKVRAYYVAGLLPVFFVAGSWMRTETSGSAAACEVVDAGIDLPGALDESSGLAIGMRDSAVLWSHNDGGNDPVLIGFDVEGNDLAEIEIESPNRDWEDMDVASCAFGSCLYLSDTGDNDERRDNIGVLRMAEPHTDVTRIDPRRFDIELPDGPRDIEAMYVLPGERLFFVTKGRNHPVTLYRYPGELRDTDEPVVLEEVQVLTRPANPLQWVTGAGASRDGRFVAVRSYSELMLFEVGDGGALTELTSARTPLIMLGEPQGEAVAFGPDGLIYLTSEARNSRRGVMNVLECALR